MNKEWIMRKECLNARVALLPVSTVSRCFESWASEKRPTLGPNVAAIICEIWRYWAILGDIRKNL